MRRDVQRNNNEWISRYTTSIDGFHKLTRTSGLYNMFIVLKNAHEKSTLGIMNKSNYYTYTSG